MVRLRLTVLALAVVLAGLGLARPATAADPPEFVVIPWETGLGRAAETELELTVPAGTPPLGKVVYYAAPGFAATLNQPLGEAIGEVEGTAVVEGKEVDIRGDIAADAPTSVTDSPCAPGTHGAVWVIRLSVGLRTFSVPLFVDLTTAEERGLGAFRLTACFASPALPEVAGGMPLGALITQLDLDFHSVVRNPSATAYHLWRAIRTPYDGAGSLNPSAAYELRSLVPVPQRLTLQSRYDKARKQAVITGSLKEAGIVEAGIVVYLYAGPSISALRFLKTLKTAKNGTFAHRRRITRATFFWAEVPVYWDDVCKGEPAAVPGGCLRQRWSPAFSSTTRLIIPKR